MYNQLDTTTTIVAPATATGGAVMVIRLSGDKAIDIADKMFRGKHPLCVATDVLADGVGGGCEGNVRS